MALPQTKTPAAFRKQVLALLGENYGDKTLILCPTVFVRLLNGDHKAAILLSQILYWSDRTKDPDGWFYKSMMDWRAETGLSEYQVRRIVNGDARVQSAQLTLRDLGVETLLRKVKRTGAPTLHYRINQETFLARLHAFLGQGDYQQCEETILENVQVEPRTESGINSAQSAASLIPTETTTLEESAEEYLSQNPTHDSDEDSDLSIFIAFESRFGKLKAEISVALRNELERLGSTKVQEVLERCATRGRSWSYVLKALANERAPKVSAQTAADEHYGVAVAFTEAEAPCAPIDPREALQPVSERLLLSWGSVGQTAQDAWSAAFHQLEMQLDRATFDSALRGATLVDFEPETYSFVVVARTSYARDMLQHRLQRTVIRVLRDVYGQPVTVQFLLEDEWRLRFLGHDVAELAAVG